MKSIAKRNVATRRNSRNQHRGQKVILAGTAVNRSIIGFIASSVLFFMYIRYILLARNVISLFSQIRKMATQPMRTLSRVLTLSKDDRICANEEREGGESSTCLADSCFLFLSSIFGNKCFVTSDDGSIYIFGKCGINFNYSIQARL